MNKKSRVNHDFVAFIEGQWSVLGIGQFIMVDKNDYITDWKNVPGKVVGKVIDEEDMREDVAFDTMNNGAPTVTFDYLKN